MKRASYALVLPRALGEIEHKLLAKVYVVRGYVAYKRSLAFFQEETYCSPSYSKDNDWYRVSLKMWTGKDVTLLFLDHRFRDNHLYLGVDCNLLSPQMTCGMSAFQPADPEQARPSFTTWLPATQHTRSRRRAWSVELRGG